jgi:hypothetical protein
MEGFKLFCKSNGEQTKKNWESYACDILGF